MSKKLEESRAENEEFKSVTERLQERYQFLKRTLDSEKSLVSSLQTPEKNLFLKVN